MPALTRDRSSSPRTACVTSASWGQRDWIWALILILAIVAAYSPVWYAGFIWDDDDHVTNNPTIIGPLGLKENWTTSAALFAGGETFDFIKIDVQGGEMNVLLGGERLLRAATGLVFEAHLIPITGSNKRSISSTPTVRRWAFD